MNRKVFISVLGTGFYSSCSYVKDDFISSETRFVQQATMEYVDVAHWSADDAVFILLTDGSRKNNWDIEITSRKNFRTNEAESYKSLQAVLKEMNLPCLVHDISIPDGKNEEEMWQIFTKLFEVLESGDELYFDLTHSFRYLPMLILVFGNYAKFLKDITVIYISYGNYEARDLPMNQAPIIDLLPLVALQEWTFAAANFKNFGKMGDLTTSIASVTNRWSIATKQERRLKESIISLKNNINEFEKRIVTCRGRELLKGDAVSAVKQHINMALDSSFPQPIKEILRSLKDGIMQFSNESIDNLRYAINWCIKYNMVQQAYTLGQESIITILCEKMKAVNPFAPTEEKGFRNYIASILGINVNSVNDEKKWSVTLTHHRLLSRAFFSLEWVKQLRKPYGKMTTNRNQINHAGFVGTVSATQIIKQLQETIEACFSILDQSLEMPTVPKMGEKLLINLSNHPYALWEQKQRDAAEVYGRCIDLPFPNIEPSCDEIEIERLSEDYFNEIQKMRDDRQLTVHVMGEFTFSCSLIGKLLNSGIGCIASCAERQVEIVDNRIKQVIFNFERFREYGCK